MKHNKIPLDICKFQRDIEMQILPLFKHDSEKLDDDIFRMKHRDLPQIMH